VQFELEVVLELLLYVSANIDGADVRHVRGAFKKENAVHQLLRMNHFLDGLFPIIGTEAKVSPVLAHFRVEKILVDGGELSPQRLAQMFQNFIIPTHGRIVAKAPPQRTLVHEGKQNQIEKFKEN